MPNRRAISDAVIGFARYIAATRVSETAGPAGGRVPGRPAAVSHRDTVCGRTPYRAASSPRENRSRSRRRRSSAAGGGGLRTLPGRWAPSRPPPGRIETLSSNSHVRTRCVVEFSRSATASIDKPSRTYSCRSRSLVGRCTAVSAPLGRFFNDPDGGVSPASANHRRTVPALTPNLRAIAEVGKPRPSSASSRRGGATS